MVKEKFGGMEGEVDDGTVDGEEIGVVLFMLIFLNACFYLCVGLPVLLRVSSLLIH